MSDYIPKFKPGHAVTFKASAAVTGGRLVAVTGDRTVGPAGADAVVIGVAGFDAAQGEDVTVFTRAGGVHALTASGAVAGGAQVISATDGKISTIGAGENPVGVALESATNDNDIVDVLFL